MERYEFVDDRSQKFWQWIVEGAELIVEFGKLGSAGQRKGKSFATSAEAQAAAVGLVREKLGKGYVRVAAGQVQAPASAPALNPASSGEALTPTQVAMILIEHVEKVSVAKLRPVDPDRAAFVERWPQTPRTLVELWDFCGGEQSNVLFVLARAALRSFPNPKEKECASRFGYINQMMLANPGEELWSAIHAPHTDPRLQPSWVPAASWGNDSLFINKKGAALVWTKHIDYPVVHAHVSFDQWMLETACALRDGIIRIAPAASRPAPGDPPGYEGPGKPVGERVICGALSYEFELGSWWDGQRRCEV